MATSISKILFGDNNKKYAGSLRRSAAAMIDIWITLIIRGIFAQIVGSLFLNQQMLLFVEAFRTEFGTDAPKNNPEHINFIIHHPIFFYMIAFYAIILMIGAIYHSYLNSSAWSATIGKRAMKIMILRKNELPLTFSRGLIHYFLSILPFIFIFYMLGYQAKYELNLYEALNSGLNMIFGIIFVLWIQIQIFTKNKTTAYDLIANTVLVNGKTAAKWPWSK